MYTINNFIFGIQPDEKFQQELEDTFDSLDLFTECELGLSYYSGHSYLTPFAIGIEITSDDGNKNYIKEVRLAKESDYIILYEQGVKKHLQDLDRISQQVFLDEPTTKEEVDILEKYKNWVKTTKPDFISVESSS